LLTEAGAGGVNAAFDEGVPIEASLPLPEHTPAGARSPRHHRRRTWPGVLGSYLGMIFILVTLNFMLPRAMPGNPVDTLVARGSSSFVFGEDSRAKLAEYYGLNKPLLTQYRDYLDRLAHGDLGRSITTNQPVTHEVARRLPWTFLLISASMVLATLIGLALGVHAGWRRDRPTDRAMMTGLLSAREFPPQLLASMLLFFLAVKLGWLPVGGGETPFSSSFGMFHRVTDIARHALLPVLVLTLGLTVGFYLVMRAGMVAELGSDYLLLGRAKGLRQRRLKYRYAARNALLPVVSLTAIEIGFAVTANLLIERVFSYPGLGELMFSSIVTRDYPSLQGAFLAFSVGIVTANALADVAYRRLDPRATI